MSLWIIKNVVALLSSASVAPSSCDGVSHTRIELHTRPVLLKQGRAKLSGLPSREVGRFERASRDALE